ncbi:MAG TPA: CorA family divalent cation transporter [Pseudolabrys sp.]|nr:CorA family divalent cation transporter [Pseudolabrys sp.]
MTHFRQILLWPVQLMPLKEGQQIQSHWELLECPGCPWQRLLDEFLIDPREFQERHYREFVTFLPHVQRVLYGEASVGSRAEQRESPIRVYRRTDIARVELALEKSPAPVVLDVAHVDLYFFYDADLVILAFEVLGNDLPLAVVQDFMFLFGRAYPPGWTENGLPFHCSKVTWLAKDGRVLAVSDFENRQKFLDSVCRHRAAAIAAHWEFLLEPMVPHHSGRAGALRYRQLEYYRMPVMAYLALDDPGKLTRADYARLAFATARGDGKALPFSTRFLQQFETEYCYDRYFEDAHQVGWSTRMMCCGHAFVMTGDARSAFFTDPERGLLGQFRHQYFVLGLLAHFHKAALLMMSDRLVSAIKKLDIDEPASVRQFRRDIRQTLEIFLRFTHRYWHHDISDQAQLRDVFQMWARHLGSEQTYRELREELHDMGQYLDSDLLRRQSTTVVRLTVVTIAGLIGTTVTGFLGMNLLAWSDAPLLDRTLLFFAVLITTVALTIFTVVRSQRLAEFLDKLSDGRLKIGEKWTSFNKIWHSPP